jgi:RNA polymerase sigma factor (sigma-70 family)
MNPPDFRSGMPPQGAYAAVETAWRVEWPKLVATLTRLVGNIDLAEDLAQDALLAAVEQWPRDGIPPRPGAWLTVTARHRAIDRIRREKNLAAKYALLGQDLLVDESASDSDIDPAPSIEDDLLRMVFVACHPVLAPAAQVALTLRLVGGLTTEEIARAYVVPTSTIAQRIVRAKRTITERQIPYSVPSGSELDERLDSVLDVICLIFTEGYEATAGDEWLRIDLAEEGLRLARLLAAMLPDQAETHGLAALLELQASRLGARSTPDSPLILLDEQDRSRWDFLLIRRGFLTLHRAQAINKRDDSPPGRYALQAAIAAEHALSRTPEKTDWERLARLYAVLNSRFPSPVVQLNRAVAVGRAQGPEAGLALVDELAATGRLDDYHLLPAVRADLLVRLGRIDEASLEFDRAAALTANTTEREMLLERARRCRQY